MNKMNKEKLHTAIYNAYKGISFDPEKKADILTACYIEELQDDLKELAQNESTGNYAEKYETKLFNWLYSMSRIMSPMITGPANFPTARMAKYRNTEEKKYNEFRNWRNRYFKAVYRTPTPSPETDLDDAIKEYDRCFHKQEFMKAVNRIRKKTNNEIQIKELKKLGVYDENIPKLIKYGFERFELTNNNAKLKRLAEKITIMKKRIHNKSAFHKTNFNGGFIDIANDRVIIKHDNKPDSETIKKLKSKGFRWSPQFKSWNRKHTTRAIYDACVITGVDYNQFNLI